LLGEIKDVHVSETRSVHRGKYKLLKNCGWKYSLEGGHLEDQDVGGKMKFKLILGK